MNTSNRITEFLAPVPTPVPILARLAFIDGAPSTLDALALEAAGVLTLARTRCRGLVDVEVVK